MHEYMNPLMLDQDNVVIADLVPHFCAVAAVMGRTGKGLYDEYRFFQMETGRNLDILQANETVCADYAEDIAECVRLWHERQARLDMLKTVLENA